MGVATRAGGVLFVTRCDTCVRACRQYSQLSVIRRWRQTCLNLSVLARFSLVDSLVVTLVEFPTLCHSSLRRAGLVSFGRLVVDRVENSLAATRELLGQPYGRCELWGHCM